MSPLKEAAIIDDGSFRCKAGLASDKTPKVVFPSLIGRSQGSGKIDEYIGDAAFARRSALNIEYPIQLGEIKNWDDMEKIWDHCLSSELSIDRREHPVVLSDIANNHMKNRERMTQIMLESLSVPAVYICSRAIMALYGVGRGTGIVVDSGYGMTQIVPICKNEIQPAGVFASCGGRDITNHLTKLLTDKYPFLNGSVDPETIRDIKESLCYMAEDMWGGKSSSATKQSLNKEYKLPDGQTINLDTERFNCAQVMYNPELIDSKLSGLQDATYSAVRRCDHAIHNDLYSNILILGGTSKIKGFDNRFKTELTPLAPPLQNINILDTPDREFTSWVGSAATASLSSFQEFSLSKAEYEEVGPSIVRRKFAY